MDGNRVRKTILTYVVLALFGPAMLGSAARSQVVIQMPAEGQVSPYRGQAVIGQAPANLPVRLDVNGLATDSTKVMPNGVFEFLGVQSPEGPVTYVVTVRYPNGGSASAERHMHILGSPDTVEVMMSSTDIPSDGWTTTPVQAVVRDRWGVVIPSGYFITVAVDSLAIQGEDADPASLGHQVRLTEGKAAFSLSPGRNAGSSVLTLSTNGITTRVSLRLLTPYVPLMVVASADATGKVQETKRPSGSLSRPEDFEEGFDAKGRLAGFARGTVFGDYLMTLSVDTDRKLQDQIFRDLDPKSLYSMYGDNSIVTYEAQSTSPVYAKLERDRSYLLYGDYHTLVTRNEFAAYNRSFTGGKLHTEGGRYSFDLFGTVTNRKVVQEEIRAQGTSGYYYLRQNNVVTGSEKVRLEARDRFHSEVVVTRKEKARYSDYEIDYIQGSLYFKQPVPSLDEQNNPVYIVVSYEAITSSANNLVAGGAAEVRPFETLTLGGTAVIEQRSPRDYTLIGGNVRWQMDDVGTIQSEAARSSDVAGSGGAWKIEADLAPFKLFRLSPYYRKVDGSFTNATQSGSGRELGTVKYGGALEVEPFGGTKLGGEFYEQHQSMGALSTDVRSLSGSVQQAIGERGDVSVRIEDVKYSGENPEAPSQDLRTHSTILTGTTRAAIVEGLRASAGFEQNLRKASKQVRPNALTLGLEYQVSSAVALFAQQKFLSGEGQLTSVGVTTKVDDQTSIYGRYELGNSISGERNAATIGLKNAWKITEELTANILYEKTKNLSKNLVEARTPDHDAVSLSVEYFPAFPLRATVKGEYNEDVSSIRRAVDFGVTYTVYDGLSLLGKGTYFIDDVRQMQGRLRQSDFVAGVAYRPAAANWLNVIGKIQFKALANSSIMPWTRQTATIASIHMYVEPLPALEFGVKYALKKSRDAYDGMAATTLSDFILVRPQYDLTGEWNVAGEIRALWQRTDKNVKVGYSLETGYVFIKNTMVAAGYNFQAYRERDLVGDVYSIAGPYITMRLKLTEELW